MSVGELLSRYGVSVVLLALGVLFLGLQASVSHIPTPVGFVLFTVGTMFATLGGGLVGRASALAEARKVVAPLIEPAFRRTLSLYRALGRLMHEVDVQRDEVQAMSGSKTSVPSGRVDTAFLVLKAKLGEQLETSNDALAEWRLVLPDAVEAFVAPATEDRS